MAKTIRIQVTDLYALVLLNNEKQDKCAGKPEQCTV